MIKLLIRSVFYVMFAALSVPVIALTKPTASTAQDETAVTAQAVLDQLALTPAALDDPERLLKIEHANQQLLQKNLELQRQLDTLSTQNNVLLQERTGQLYLYGVFSCLGSMMIGLFAGWLIFNRRNRW